MTTHSNIIGLAQNRCWLLLLGALLVLVASGCGSDGTDDVDGDFDATDSDEIVIPVTDGDEEVDVVDSEIEGELELEPDAELADEEPDSIVDGDLEVDAFEQNDGEELSDGDLDQEDVFAEIDFEPPPIESCTPGERICLTNKLLTCNADGYSYTREICPVGQICAIDNCYDIICEPGQVQCQSGDVFSCSPEGTQYTLQSICRPPQTCQDGACVSVCSDAPEIALNELVTGDSTETINAIEVDSSCWETSGVPMLGPDRVYRIQLQQGQAIHATVTSLTQHFDPAIYLFADCERPADSCLTGSDECCASMSDSLDFTAPETATYYLVVDSWENRGGQFTLKVSGAQSQSADVQVGNVSIEHDADSNISVISAELYNAGPDPARNIQLDAFLYGEEQPQAPAYRSAVYSELLAGERETAVFRFPNPPLDVWSVWLEADADYTIPDPDRSNNVVGPLPFRPGGGVTETIAEAPVQTSGRLREIGDEDYYRLSCEKNRILLLGVDIDAEASSLDPVITVYEQDDTTVLASANDGFTQQSERLLLTCPVDGRVRVKISAAPAALLTHKTGSYELRISGLSGYDVRPAVVNLLPSQQRLLTVSGLFEPLFPLVTMSLNSRCSYYSTAPGVVSVSRLGVVRAAENAPNRQVYVVVTPQDPTVEASAVPVQVSDTVPGEIFISEDEFPIEIPDNKPGGVSSTITIDQDVEIGALYVGISITHPKVRNLLIDLIAPDNRKVRLFDGTGSGANLVTVYGIYLDPSGPGSLFDLAGMSAQGQWRLQVEDTQANDVGRLNTWRLYLVEAQP